jgi:hypothetical protein
LLRLSPCLRSKASKDTDAQVLRACVLLDELIQSERPGGAGGPVVVAEIKTEDALPLVRYACSQRVLPVPTNKVNARRMVRLLHHPIAAVFSRCLTDFYSPAHGTIDRIPEVEGLHFRELHCRFPGAGAGAWRAGCQCVLHCSLHSHPLHLCAATQMLPTSYQPQLLLQPCLPAVQMPLHQMLLLRG